MVKPFLTFFSCLPETALRNIVRAFSDQRFLDEWRLKLPFFVDVLLLSPVSPFEKVFSSLFDHITVTDSSADSTDDSIRLQTMNENSFVLDSFRHFGHCLKGLTIRAVPNSEPQMTRKVVDDMFIRCVNVRTLTIALHAEQYQGDWDGFVLSAMKKLGPNLETLDFRASKMTTDQTRASAESIAQYCSSLRRLSFHTRRVKLDSVQVLWEAIGGGLEELELNTAADNNAATWTETISAIRLHCRNLHTLLIESGKHGCQVPQLFQELLCSYGTQLRSTAIGKRTIFLYSDDCWRLRQGCPQANITFEGLHSSLRELRALGSSIVQLRLVIMRGVDPRRFSEAVSRCPSLEKLSLQVSKGVIGVDWDNVFGILFQTYWPQLQTINLSMKYCALDTSTLLTIIRASGDLRNLDVHCFDLTDINQIRAISQLAPRIEKVALKHHGTHPETVAEPEVGVVLESLADCSHLRLADVEMFSFSQEATARLATKCIAFRPYRVHVVLNGEIMWN